MAKVNIYFQDLSDEKKDELWEYLREQLKDEIDKAMEDGADRETLENEIIDNYINTHNHNMGMEFEI